MISRSSSVILLVLLLESCQIPVPAPDVELGSARYDQIKWISGADKAGFSELEDEIALADFEFHLDGDEMLIPADEPDSKGFALPRSMSVLGIDHSQFPGFVVVQLHKLAQIDHVDSRVVRINEYFFNRGSERVLVTGFRGFGRSIYSDKLNKPNKSRLDNPLPRPESEIEP